jgi:hypothetical protein
MKYDTRPHICYEAAAVQAKEGWQCMRLYGSCLRRNLGELPFYSGLQDNTTLICQFPSRTLHLRLLHRDLYCCIMEYATRCLTIDQITLFPSLRETHVSQDHVACD